MATVVGPVFQAGESLSDPLNVTGMLASIAVPADWEPALLTFQASPDDGTTWFDLMNSDNTEMAFNIRPGTLFNIKNTALDNKAWIKFRSGSSRYPVPQMTEKTFTLYMI